MKNSSGYYGYAALLARRENISVIICNLTVFFTLNLEDIYRNANTKVPSKDLVNITNNTSLYTAGVMIFYLSQAKSMKWNLARSGFTGCKTAITKWSKHGIINLLIPGHDPPVDITIYVDICRNPGPVLSGLDLNIPQGQSQNGGKFIRTAVVDKTTYNRSKLLDIRSLSTTQANSHLLSTLKHLGLFRYRGSRGGKRIIPVIISHRDKQRRPAWGHRSGTVDWNNLVSIKCHPENRDKIPSQLPHVLLSNIRSLVPKFDELSTFLMLNRADLVAISKTWLNEQIDSSFFGITGYDLYRLDRTKWSWRRCMCLCF